MAICTLYTDVYDVLQYGTLLHFYALVLVLLLLLLLYYITIIAVCYHVMVNKDY